MLYASSEGQAGLLADSLGDALELIIGLPMWRDYLGFSAGGRLGGGLEKRRSYVLSGDTHAADDFRLEVGGQTSTGSPNWQAAPGRLPHLSPSS
ncbi:MAG TPA: hypothetical protein VFA45_22780 [Actinomycetes bacterium]|nr:hypothetical protein [Actinomycetes bacterium]